MDLSTILGMVLAVVSISTGDILEGGNPLHVLHLASFIIVVPTAAFCAMTSTHKKIVKGAYKELKVVFKGSGVNLSQRIAELVEYSTIARRDGLLALESKTNEIDNEFLKEAMMMMVDGKSVEEIKENMEIQVEEMEEYYKECAEYWIRFGETCPTMGLVGAVFGLILALKLLDDPQAMAAGISGAFTATVTGIFGAYALFGPWGNKMKANSHDLIKERMVIMQAIVSIAEGANPRDLEAKLFNYLSHDEPRISQFDK
ncbi:flagellar motor stator protein MotA [Campylobacter peloridis]|uniref:Flagellar motor stator protein MotA n=1 Tax=Campylobacter peloridis TaxID=488546 RepID=A0A5C7DPW3_9BACT|nr:flagellar motor stator protein MotA [Campylobacter peloridis]AJC85251.1 flagellar motor protein [Campylobacter peloridis LMG 23910]MBX1885617.1 flagellar motor stator protein MotA [Campylobacter peloridis]MBX2078308.1 flagellar motor stator protein MotA [Campylobacter peloridis]QOQ89269.1 flagellar motor stator protein MotA [Campylobacter peloridis]TXE83152.1 flagellar motor stator protein MotA [Campylobacter peloridis]